jgi:hypothetical protein
MDFNELPPAPPLLNDKSEEHIVKRSPAQQGTNVPSSWKPTLSEPIPVVRCTGTTSSGAPCTRWSIRGANVCIKHGAQLPAVKKAAAQRVETARIMMMGAATDMYDVLFSLAQEGNEAGIRLKAATEILDRAGLKAGQEVNVTVEHVGSPINEILEQLAVFTESGDTDDDIVDAETEEEFDDSDSDI